MLNIVKKPAAALGLTGAVLAVTATISIASDAAANAKPNATPANPINTCAYGQSVPGLNGYLERSIAGQAASYAKSLHGATAAERKTAARTFAAAAAAYVYGIALVDERSDLKSFRLRNEAITLDTLATPQTQNVVSPNNDTVYTVSFLDLTSGPMVVSVPNTHGRFYTFQFLDAYTNAFKYLGTGSTGTAAGAYAFVPPGWKGTLPANVHRVQSPTNTVWLLGRTLVKNQADLQTVKPTLEQDRVTPLALWETGQTQPPLVLSSQPSTGSKQAAPTGTSFIALLNQELTIDPPPAGQDCALEAMAPAGVKVPSRSSIDAASADAANAAGNPQPAQTSSATSAAIAAGTAAGTKIIDGAATTLDQASRRTHDGWEVAGSWVGDYGRRYLARAIIAVNLIGANTPRQAMYPMAYTDNRGRTLTGAGSRRYTITFPKGKLPPVKAFWSLTLYDPQDFLYANQINRYEIGTRTTGLHRARNGSLTLYIQHAEPKSAAQRANWLPAPAGQFHLILRLYEPRQAALTGRWKIPPIVRRAG